MTVTAKPRIISALLLAFSSLAPLFAAMPAQAEDGAAVAMQGNVLKLAENAPDQHVVVRGDTLWDISGKFLKEPWRWPEIWGLNKDQIKDPHWIYPGQVVFLDRSGDRPRLRVGNPLGTSASGQGRLGPKIYAQDNREAIPSIPQKLIEPFLSQPLVIEAGALDSAPRIVATQEDRVVVGAGNTAYAVGIRTGQPMWQVYRPGKALVDPEDGQVLGYEAFYLGSARLAREGRPAVVKPGHTLQDANRYNSDNQPLFNQEDAASTEARLQQTEMPATLEIVKSTQEIARGDRLVPAPPPQIINYMPHAPDRPIKSRVMTIYGGVNEGSNHSIVTISRGARDGLEVGHVLALSRSGVAVDERFQGQLTTYRLPDEQYGHLFVFRVFDRVSYALVMNVSRPVIIGDAATTP